MTDFWTDVFAGFGPTLKRRIALVRYLGAGALVCLATALSAALASLTPLDSVSALYMLPVVVSAVRHGTGPAIFAALLGALMSSLFYPPLFSVLVVQPAQFVDLVVSLVVALTIGRLTARIRAEMLAARERERQIRHLYRLGSDMAAASDTDSIYRLVANHMGAALERPVAIFVAGRDGKIEAVPGSSAPPNADQLVEAIKTLLAAPSPARQETERLQLPAGESWLLCRLGEAGRAGAVIAVPLTQEAHEPSAEWVAQARSILNEGSRSLDRLGLTRAVEERNLRRRTDELRDILLESVSHELRTPIAGIMGSAGVLATAAPLRIDPRLLELAQGIEAEARRLDLRVQNLLDVTRIRSGALLPRLEAVDPLDIVNSAVDAARDRLREHRILRAMSEDLPLVHVDAVLIEQALINLLENAAKFSPAGSAIRVNVKPTADGVAIAVVDAGAGLDEGQTEQIFERFYRGERHADFAGGSGLGLTIARVFVEGNGGTIVASSQGPGLGSTLCITLPGLPERLRKEDEDE